MHGHVTYADVAGASVRSAAPIAGAPGGRVQRPGDRPDDGLVVRPGHGLRVQLLPADRQVVSAVDDAAATVAPGPAAGAVAAGAARVVGVGSPLQ